MHRLCTDFTYVQISAAGAAVGAYIYVYVLKMHLMYHFQKSRLLFSPSRLVVVLF